MADSIKLPAIKGIIGNWIYYQTVVSFKEVVDRIDNDHSIREYKSLDDHLQRDLSKRSKRIADYLLREESRFFNSVILGVFGDSPSWFSFQFAPSPIPEMSLPEEILDSIGILELTGNEILFSIDGQHRIDGIKQALRKSPNSFDNDELAVIIVAHNDTRQGKQKTRRLFSEINTKAVKVSGLDDLITNEDNPIDINTRRIYVDFAPFEKDRYIVLSPKVSIAANSDHFTTILNLKSVNKILYSSSYKFQDVRPSDDIIEDLYQMTIQFWDQVTENIPSYRQVFLNESAHVQDYRHSDGGSLLFRPIGIELLAEVYSVWLKETGGLENFFSTFNRIDYSLTSIYWKDIIWDNAKKNIKTKTSFKFLKNYIQYLLGLDYDNKYTLIEFNKLKGNEDLKEDTLEKLPLVI